MAEERQGALAAQCKALQLKLDEALRERDALVLDLENMCLDQSSSFSTSSVLAERITSTGKFAQAVSRASRRRRRKGARAVPLPSPAPCCHRPLLPPLPEPSMLPLLFHCCSRPLFMQLEASCSA